MMGLMQTLMAEITAGLVQGLVAKPMKDFIYLFFNAVCSSALLVYLRGRCSLPNCVIREKSLVFYTGACSNALPSTPQPTTSIIGRVLDSNC